MILFDLSLETRIAMSMAVDDVVCEFADDLECADFVTQPAARIFACVRRVQARALEVTADTVAREVYLWDRQAGLWDARRGEVSAFLPFHPDALYGQLFASGGPFETLTDTIAAVQRLRAIRVRRDKLIALSERSEDGKRAAAIAERERQFARSA